ncbi:sugar phosphate isomerase/epimerase family protein [Tumebacillus permanentifrigoris]|uniref:Sugar phosphate isomerase/epimerase n=1 Tax=Tumebacillus permanentifrigoris TaxID=378543 RepID=A0A316DEE6_9BACL|nr:sugar phosphate isomerase/epimerase family protein [Tumebacillus permanentifrigoris]PWK16571.1 sugar phosphate isomerase/epimerase [Tumebacillus permanentifrigoris]
MRIGTQDKPFFPADFAGKLRTIRLMGFETFEVDGKAVLERFAELKAAIRETGVPISTACGGYQGWIGDFQEERRQQAIAEIGEILKRLAELSGRGIVVPAAWGMFSKRLPPMIPPRSEEQDRQVLLDSLERINRVAQATGTYLYLEPLNRYEDHMINKLSDAVSLLEEGQFSHVKVIADLYHMNIEEASIEDSLRRAQAYLGHIHLADSHRYQPGDGHLDFVSAFQVLQEIEYAGDLVFECRVMGTPEVERYRDSVEYVKRCLERAGL